MLALAKINAQNMSLLDLAAERHAARNARFVARWSSDISATPPRARTSKRELIASQQCYAYRAASSRIATVTAKAY